VPADRPARAEADGAGAVLSNGLIRVRIDGLGQLSGVRDEAVGREVLAPGARGNVLQLFEDRPVAWDAWDIDPFFEDRLEPEGTAAAVSITETGPLRAEVTTVRRMRNSTVTQRIRLRAGSRRIDFDTEVDWRETHILMKVAFPVDVAAQHATFDIQWGVIQRVTHANTTFDAARFEVAGQKWADLSEPGYGVALLNDCKYGYDVRGQTLRLSLIKSATEPDPTADRGLHRFTYALLPHEGGWTEGVAAEAFDLNHPLRVWRGDAEALPRPPVVDRAHVILRTWKPAEDGRGTILRLHEAQGRRGRARVRVPWDAAGAEICDFHEVATGPAVVEDGAVVLDLAPWEIVTVRVPG
jgi:alpha-mannosidase